MREAIYERNKNTIKDLSTGNVVPLGDKTPSINKAKKKSRELQETNGGLGMGAVRVVKPEPI